MSKAARWTMWALGSTLLVNLACGAFDYAGNVLVHNQLNVPGGGGFSQVMFHALAGQQVLITLTAITPAMIPFGQLSGPDGTVAAAPPLTSALNGVNSAQVLLPNMGVYTLAVYDGSNLGGQVAVQVEVVP